MVSRRLFSIDRREARLIRRNRRDGGALCFPGRVDAKSVDVGKRRTFSKDQKTVKTNVNQPMAPWPLRHVGLLRTLTVA